MILFGELSFPHPVDGPHALGLAVPHWNDHAPSHGKLSEECLRDFRRPTRDDDAIKGRKHGFALVAITVIQRGLPPHGSKQGTGGIKQRFLTFDAVHLVAECAQHGALIATASPDFQNVLARSRTEQFRLLRHGMRLADGLACGNGEGLVGISKLGER